MPTKTLTVDTSDEAQAIADYLYTELAGHFKFDPNDTQELSKIKTGVTELISKLDNTWVERRVNNVFYELDYLAVIFTEKDTFENNSKTMKIWVDVYKETNATTDTIDSDSPYDVEALLSLSIRQFKQLVENIDKVKAIINDRSANV